MPVPFWLPPAQDRSRFFRVTLFTLPSKLTAFAQFKAKFSIVAPLAPLCKSRAVPPTALPSMVIVPPGCVEPSMVTWLVRVGKALERTMV